VSAQKTFSGPNAYWNLSNRYKMNRQEYGNLI